MIEMLNEHLHESQAVKQSALSKMNKKARIKRLIELRRFYFDLESEARKEAEQKARDAFDKEYPEFTNDEEIENLSKREIYCLSNEVLNLDRYKSVLNE